MPNDVPAVVLARGLGTRMRRQDPAARLEAAQARVADTGLKAMISVGRPFLDYVLSALADAGVRHVCLVIGPEHDVVRGYYGRVARPSRIRVSFAVQEQARGTADAVVAAAACVGDRPFLVLNSDNYYPVDAYRVLLAFDGPGLVAFEPASLVRDGNIPAERLAAFAVLRISDNGTLVEIEEKPDAAVLADFGDAPAVSMNLWRLDRRVLDCCRDVTLSRRGELELPDAVRLAQQRGVAFRVAKMAAGVLDLSSRADIAAVAERLASVRVRL